VEQLCDTDSLEIEELLPAIDSESFTISQPVTSVESNRVRHFLLYGFSLQISSGIRWFRVSFDPGGFILK
jgi:hypothetical protein